MCAFSPNWKKGIIRCWCTLISCIERSKCWQRICRCFGLQLSSYNLFSVGTGIEYSVNELVNMIKTITKKNIDILNKPLPFGDALRSCADNSKLIGFGWKTSTHIKKGLQLTWQAIAK